MKKLQRRLTADKRLRYAPPKLPLATSFIRETLQERHKIEHNKAQIDRVFLARMAKRNVQHAYKEGDSIQKSHIDVLLTFQAIREFAEDVDRKVSKLIKRQNGG